MLLIGWGSLLVSGAALGVCVRGAIAYKSSNAAFWSAAFAGVNIGCIVWDALYLATKLR